MPNLTYRSPWYVAKRIWSQSDVQPYTYPFPVATLISKFADSAVTTKWRPKCAPQTSPDLVCNVYEWYRRREASYSDISGVTAALNTLISPLFCVFLLFAKRRVQR